MRQGAGGAVQVFGLDDLFAFFDWVNAVARAAVTALPSPEAHSRIGSASYTRVVEMKTYAADGPKPCQRRPQQNRMLLFVDNSATSVAEMRRLLEDNLRSWGAIHRRRGSEH